MIFIISEPTHSTIKLTQVVIHHTQKKNNISLPLAKLIVGIVTNNKGN